MIYSNVRRAVEPRDTPFGVRRVVHIGYRGREELSLLVPNGFSKQLAAGEVIHGFSVYYTVSGLLLIVPEEDGNLYLLLDHEDDPQALGGLAKASYKIIVSARGERVGIVDGATTIFKGKDGDVFLVKEFGGIPSVLYFVSNNTVHHCKFPLVKKMFEALGREPPFTLIEGRFNPKEWRKLTS